MNFNPQNVAIFRAVSWSRLPLFGLSRFFKVSFLLLGLILLGLFILNVLIGEAVFGVTSDKFLGGALVGFSLTICFWEIELFFDLKLKNPKLEYALSEAVLRPEDFNLAAFLDYEAAIIYTRALRAAKRKRLGQSFVSLLLYSLVNSSFEEIDFVFNRGMLDREKLKENLKQDFLKVKSQSKVPQEDGLKKNPEQPDLSVDQVMLTAAKITVERKKERVGIGALLISFAQEHPTFKEFLVESEFKKEDIENLVFWYERIRAGFLQSKKFWQRENLLKRGSIGKDWAAGYSITLDKYSLDLREKLRKSGFKEIIGHQKEIKQIERVLAKEELNNVLLVGEPGTGRKSIIEALAQRAFFGKSAPQINYKRILNFNLIDLVAELTSQEEVETVLDRCLAEAVRAGNIIMVIDEFHNFVSEIPQLGTVNISEVLSRYLPLSTFQVIAITSYSGLHRIIERNPSLLNFFEKVEVAEISLQETLIFLENYVPFFEAREKKFISYKALRELLKLSGRYLTEVPFPEKAIRLLDEAITFLALYTKDPILREDHIKRVVSEKTGIPFEQVEAKEKEVLLNLEKLIHQRIVNQEEAVKEVSSALRRARAEIQVRNRPIGSFLFLGPTGVGKTETSKVLSAIYFGSEKRMVRLDMSNFQNINDIARLIGSYQGEEGLLTTSVRENPFSLLLLDEIEKAHPKILNLFLQVLDEGWLTDGFGRKVDFQNTIIIATSNAGAEVIREDIKQDKKMDIVKEDLLDYIFKQGIFQPEFINRFDAVVVFKPLTKENLLDIAQLMLNNLAKGLEDKGIKLEITQGLKEKLVELGYEPAFGAREMRRVLQDKVENTLAEAILSGRLKRGDSVKVDPKDFSLCINS